MLEERVIRFLTPLIETMEYRYKWDTYPFILETIMVPVQSLLLISNLETMVVVYFGQ